MCACVSMHIVVHFLNVNHVLVLLFLGGSGDGGVSLFSSSIVRKRISAPVSLPPASKLPVSVTSFALPT